MASNEFVRTNSLVRGENPLRPPNEQDELSLKKRNIRVALRLTQSEHDRLTRLAEKSGLSISALIRHLIMGVELKETPPASVLSKFVYEIRKLGILMNQLVALAHAKGFIDEPKLCLLLKDIRELEQIVVQTYTMEK